MRTIVILAVLALGYYLITGRNPINDFMGGGSSLEMPGRELTQQQLPRAERTGQNAPDLADADSVFVSKVLGSTEDFWNQKFPADAGTAYRAPALVLFSGYVQSACGMAQSAMGPFYCPRDQKVYIDLSFYSDMKNKLGAPGDFAQAYVIAHEVGHHIQNVLGILDKTTAARMRMGEADANAMQVMVELQADCLAGMWGAGAAQRNQLSEGDIEEALNAASAIGDDRLQKRSQGYVVPESFTHGSSEQRMRWFAQGVKARSIKDCDTFAAGQL
jgi:uncharacterized protein